MATVPGLPLIRQIAARVLLPPVERRDITGLPWIDTTSGMLTQPANLSTVMHASRLIVEPLAALPWVVRQGTKIVPAPRWITDPLLMRSDNRLGLPGLMSPAATARSYMDLRSEWLLDALWNGAGFLLFAEDAGGGPRAGTMRVIASQMVTADPASAGQPPRWRIIGGGAYPDVLLDVDGRVRVGEMTWRMIMLRGEPPYDPWTGRGTGVLQRASADLELMGRIQRYSSGVYRAGVPAGYLKSQQQVLTKDHADALKAAWMSAHGGDTRSIAVLNATTDFQPISLSPEAMAVVDSKRLAMLDVANAFGVPPYKLGAAQSSMTYSTVELETDAFIRDRLNPLASRIEAVLSPLLPAGQDVHVDFRGMSRGDSTTRVAYYAAGIRDGWLSWQQAAEAEGFDPDVIAAQRRESALALPGMEEESDDSSSPDAAQ